VILNGWWLFAFMEYARQRAAVRIATHSASLLRDCITRFRLNPRPPSWRFAMKMLLVLRDGSIVTLLIVVHARP
jgi:hypothetical protein